MKNNLKYFIIIIIFFLVGFFLINKTASKSDIVNIKHADADIKQVSIGWQNIRVDLALTPAVQERGLSGRNTLKDDEGMLFIFEKPDKYLFWMKDMNFPIDMIWIGPASTQGGEDFKIVYIKKDATPESYPKSFGPDDSNENAKYVLEVVSGFSDKNNLKIGDEVLFTY